MVKVKICGKWLFYAKAEQADFIYSSVMHLGNRWTDAIFNKKEGTFKATINGTEYELVPFWQESNIIYQDFRKAS